MVWGPSYEGFYVFVLPVFGFPQKLILPGFLSLFEGYSENLREISDLSMYITFLGMVWGPSYEGFCDFKTSHEYLTGTPRVSHGDPTSISRGSHE